MAEPRFELYEKAGWHWRLADANGRIVASSFRYATKANAKRAAQKAKDAATAAEIVEARPDVDVTRVAGAAFGASVKITVTGLGVIESKPAPQVTLPATGGEPSKTAAKAMVGPRGLFLTSGPLQAACRGAVGPSGSSTGQASLAEVDLLGATLTATAVASTCTANETGATASTTLAGGMLVLDEDQIVSLPDAPAPNTTYEGRNADTGDTFSVVLNEQVPTASGITVVGVHVILNGPTASGDIVLASSSCGVTTSPA